MSNATTLQTNNNKLSANNTDLVSILNTINNLPEAGGGSGGSGNGGIQTATITLEDISTSDWTDKQIRIFWLTCVNGEIVRRSEYISNSNLDRVLSNVVIGSDIFIWDKTATTNFKTYNPSTNTSVITFGGGGPQYLIQIWVHGDGKIIIQSL